MQRLLLAPLTATLLLGATAFAFAQGAGHALEFANSHPVDNARLSTRPALGDSVPQGVELKRIEGNDRLAYFYYDGRPILVDLKTRSVVRVGQ